MQHIVLSQNVSSTGQARQGIRSFTATRTCWYATYSPCTLGCLRTVNTKFCAASCNQPLLMLLHIPRSRVFDRSLYLVALALSAPDVPCFLAGGSKVEVGHVLCRAALARSTSNTLLREPLQTLWQMLPRGCLLSLSIRFKGWSQPPHRP